jgi:hypothetical protein
MIHIMLLDTGESDGRMTPVWREELGSNVENDRVGPSGDAPPTRFGWRPDLDPVPGYTPLRAEPEETVEPEVDTAPESREVEQPPETAEPEPQPETAGEAPWTGEPFWAAPRPNSSSSASDATVQHPRSPARQFKLPRAAWYVLALVLIVAGLVGFGLWMRGMSPTPGSSTTAASSQPANGSQPGVGGGSGTSTLAVKTV